MDVLSWSRHHRLFPGEGAFDLRRLRRPRPAAGYDGPLSLEVFNDIFRQTDVRPDGAAGAAVADAGWRTRSPASASALARPTEPTRLPDVGRAGRVRLRRGEGRGHRRGRRPPRPARLHVPRPAPQQGGRGCGPRAGAGGLQRAAGPRRRAPTWRPSAFEVADAGRLGRPGARRSRPRRSTGGPSPTRSELAAFRAPDGTEVFLGRSPAARTPPGSPEFEGGDATTDAALLTGIDHVNLAEPWQ